MAELLLYSRKVDTVFELLGSKEDDISYSLGWCLYQADSLLSKIVEKLTGLLLTSDQLANTKVSLQTNENKRGRTDFEIVLENEFAIIIEAKKGWILPNENQLLNYSQRDLFKKQFKIRLLVTFSECEQYYADTYLPVWSHKSIILQHFSYTELNSLVKKAIITTRSIHEKGILQQFFSYLNKLVRMQKIDSNWVYVVSLGTGKPDCWQISWIDIVEKKEKYFHYMGLKGWPNKPPNYIAFRYNGKLQSIHHVKNFLVSHRLADHFPEAPQDMNAHEPHFIYELGKPIKPSRDIRTGKNIVRNTKVYCMLDTLLTNETISDAYAESNERNKLILQ